MDMKLQRRASKRSGPEPLSSKNKRFGAEEEDELGLLTETIKMIDNLYEMRFIQKISRPIEKRVKEQYVQKFAGKMESLHQKLERISAELTDMPNVENTNISRSVRGSVTNKPINWKKSIRQIENRYMQVFYEGSFKYYYKLEAFNQFSYALKTIDIQEWARKCHEESKPREDCC